MSIEHVYIEPYEIASGNLQRLCADGLTLAGKSILDLGCGTGTYTRLMAEGGANSIKGVDSVLANIDIARDLNAHPHIEYAVDDIESWDIPGRYDIIFMRGVSYYLREDHEELIRHLSGYLSPGGHVFITFLQPSLRASLINLLKKFASWVPGMARPVVRFLLTAGYYLLVLLTEQRIPHWRVLIGKMNTVFFPARHLINHSIVCQSLAEHGFNVRGIYWGQGQNPRLSDEYGIWAMSQESA